MHRSQLYVGCVVVELVAVLAVCQVRAASSVSLGTALEWKLSG